jgi:RHS repeat-associated protein
LTQGSGSLEPSNFNKRQDVARKRTRQDAPSLETGSDGRFAVSGGGTAVYLHHDQQGSTRLITGSTGATEGKCSYGAYGAPTGEGTATTQLGYDGQYTKSDTGLVYMPAREYDPATAQFLSVDPLVGLTGLRGRLGCALARAPVSWCRRGPIARRR